MSAADKIEKVTRLSYGRLVAVLAARTGGVTDAMDALSDAVLRALKVWPARGIPSHPEAWLIATARNRVADAGRGSARAVRAADTLAEMGQAATPDNTLNRKRDADRLLPFLT